MLEQVPAQMGEEAVRWAKLVIPLVIHSASKVRLRAAAAMEMGIPLLLEKQAEVAAVIEPMMSSVSICVCVSVSNALKMSAAPKGTFNPNIHATGDDVCLKYLILKLFIFEDV